MVIVGIDPGINGAACAFYRGDDEGPEFVADAIDLPTEPDGTKNQIAVVDLSKWLRKVGAVRAFVERVTPMPSIGAGDRRSMGATSAFRFGGAVYAIRTTCRLSGIPVTLVTPSVWKKFHDLIKTGKEDSRQLALQLYPEAAHFLKRKKDHQRSEAILIAKWGDDWMRKNGR